MTLTATGAAQTPLEGNALASGCTGCDGKAIYATISEVLSNVNWYDGLQGLIVEDGDMELYVGTSKKISLYAVYKNATPKRITLPNSSITISTEPTSQEVINASSLANGTVEAVNAGSVKITLTETNTEKNTTFNVKVLAAPAV